MSNEESIQRGIGAAFAEWCNDHPVSLVDIVEKAVKEAFAEFLRDNRNDVLDAVSKERPRAE